LFPNNFISHVTMV